MKNSPVFFLKRLDVIFIFASWYYFGRKHNSIVTLSNTVSWLSINIYRYDVILKYRYLENFYAYSIFVFIWVNVGCDIKWINTPLDVFLESIVYGMHRVTSPNKVIDKRTLFLSIFTTVTVNWKNVIIIS